jgi:hypothetical protein
MTEQLLKGFLVDVTLEDYWLGKKECVEDFEIEVDQDMIDCAKIYVDYVQERAKRLNGKLLVEQKVRCQEISEDLYGYADALIITPHKMCVIDLKTGKYPVSPEHNKQAMIYAVGALSRYGNEDTEVEITIVQPRATWGNFWWIGHTISYSRAWMHAWKKTLYLFMGIIVAFVTQEASAIYINNIIKEKLMSEENKTEAEELTVKFADDGKEHKVNDMPDEAKQLYVRWQDKRRIRDDFIIKANNDIDDLNILLSSYEARMKNILEPKDEEKTIEVSG